jgi:hypothetical protein
MCYVSFFNTLILACYIFFPYISHGKPAVLYGANDIKEVNDYSPGSYVFETAKSVGGIFYLDPSQDHPDQYLEKVGNEYYIHSHDPAQIYFWVCSEICCDPNEPYEWTNFCIDTDLWWQKTAPFCSGVLVEPDLFLTAEHCIEYRDGFENDPNYYTNLAVYFNWVYDESNNLPLTIDEKDVYLFQGVHATGELDDWILMRLKRTVAGISPLLIERDDVEVNTYVYSIGHPVGLPKKVISGDNNNTKVWRIQNSWIEVNLDSFKGMSGAPILNKSNNKIISIAGMDFHLQDYQYICDRNCLELLELNDDHGLQSGQSWHVTESVKQFMSYILWEPLFIHDRYYSEIK